MLAEAEELGFHTLRGAAHEEEGRSPYAPLVEALDPLAARRPELAGALTDSAQAALSRLLPSVRRPAGAAEEPVDRHRVFSAIAQLLAQAAGERGVMLAIDDLHAADEATAALVHHLARSAIGERLLVVAGMRDEPLPKAAALVRSSLLERGAAVELALGPLDRAALAAVARRAAARPLPAGALAAIERSAAGNPFFAEELAASVDASGEVTVPPRLRAVVARRLERLEPFGERLLAALAVIDDGFTGMELAALAGAERCGRGARRGGGGGCARVRAWPLPLPARARARRAGRPAARGGAAPHPCRVQPRCSPRTTRRPRRWRTTCCAPATRGRPSRSSRRRPSGPRASGPTATAPSGPSWRSKHADEHERPGLLALRARLLHGAGEPRAPAAYAEAIAVAPAERVPGLRAQQARACLAAGDLPGAKAALEGVRGRAA